MNYPDNPIDFIKQYSFSDKQRVYTNGSELISVFRVGQMIEHYMSDLTPQQIKDMQFCLREKSRERAELRRELQELKKKKNDGWIPVEERLPEDDIEVLITYSDVDNENETGIDITTYGYATLGGNKLGYKEWRNPFPYFKGNYKVIAWRPLPGPYRPEQPETCKYTGGSCCWPIDQCGECPNNRKGVKIVTNREAYERDCEELEQYRAIGTMEECRKAVKEEDILKFYYCESEDDYYIGKRVGNFYYARYGKTGFTWFMSRYLPWGKHVIAQNTVWKEHTYPSEPKEIPFFEWIQGFMKKYCGGTVEECRKAVEKQKARN